MCITQDTFLINIYFLLTLHTHPTSVTRFSNFEATQHIYSVAMLLTLCMHYNDTIRVKCFKCLSFKRTISSTRCIRLNASISYTDHSVAVPFCRGIMYAWSTRSFLKWITLTLLMVVISRFKANQCANKVYQNDIHQGGSYT